MIADETAAPGADLLRGEHRYRRLVELALDCTCVCRGRSIGFINAAGVRLLGATAPAEVVGRALADFIHPDYRDLVADGLAELAGESGPVPMKLLRLDGRVVDAEVAVMPLGGAAQPAFMIEARDVTERNRSAERLREREQRLQGIMDTVAEGIVTADECGVIQSFNPAAELIFGLARSEAIGRNLSTLMPEPFASAHQAQIAAYLAGGRAKLIGTGRELVGRRQDGSTFPMDVSLAELRQGRSRLFIGVVRDITERKRVDEALRRARDELETRVEERTRALQRLSRQTSQILNSANDGIIGLDAAEAISFANPAAAKMTGHPVERLVGRSLRELIAEAGTGGGLWQASGHGQLQRRDGSIFPVEYARAPIEEAGATVGAVVVFRDVAERLRAEEKLRLAATVFETIAEGIVVTDAQHRITAVNPAYTAITGYTAEELCGTLPTFLASGRLGEAEGRRIWQTVATAGHWAGELWDRRKNGEEFAERLAISRILDDYGAIRQYVVVLSDITQRKQDEERIRYQANFDALTGLPNRALFIDRLSQALAGAARNGEQVGLLFIDLDGFKLVNDTLGHDIGDRLLQQAGSRLEACVRVGDTVARLGGDEFTVIMPNLGEAKNAASVATRIIEALARPFSIDHHEAFVSGSIGITAFPDDARDAHALLKNGDAAMYRAKEQGKANFQFFTQDLNVQVTERLVMKNGLSKALDRQEFTLCYQPKIDLAHGHITGVEALLRWRSGELGSVSPVKFIPVLEESGLIGPVGEWALEVACRQHKAWAAQGFPNVRVAVNLSVRQLRQPRLAQQVQDLLDRVGISPAGLELEITESMIMRDTENAVATLRELHEMGIHLAMDDFGTGYSSLSYLKRFPLHTIKIDRSFVSDIASDQDDHEIIKTIISMGHSLRRRIVAEGVETEAQRTILKRLRCDEIQGYLISPPVDADRITCLLAEQGRD